ncbi:MAG: hypothetical protein KAI40_07920 [Desulfobacterales bacterium]|nr:hypothetical protein [Desulfobacterales bacterium]
MTAQTARTTILTTPDFKAWLAAEASKEEVSISELIRTRCESQPTDDELELKALTQQLNKSTHKAEKAIEQGLSDVKKVLAEIRSNK